MVERVVTRGKHSTRATIWCLAIILLAALCWLVGSFVVPFARVAYELTYSGEQILSDGVSASIWLTSDVGQTEALDIIEHLGGSERAVEQLKVYIASPDFLARRRAAAVGLLTYCGYKGLLALGDYCFREDREIARIAAEGLAGWRRDWVGYQPGWDRSRLLPEPDADALERLAVSRRRVLDRLRAGLLSERDPDRRLLMAVAAYGMTAKDADNGIGDANLILGEVQSSLMHARDIQIKVDYLYQLCFAEDPKGVGREAVLEILKSDEVPLAIEAALNCISCQPGYQTNETVKRVQELLKHDSTIVRHAAAATLNIVGVQGK